MDELFDDVGKKIQKFAEVTFWIWLVLTGIAFIVGLFFLEEFLWFLYLLLGCIVSFVLDLIASWLLYGFGVIVENSEFTLLNAKQAMLRSVALDQAKVQSSQKPANTTYGASVYPQRNTTQTPPKKSTAPVSGWSCSCGYRNSDSSKECASCYRPRSGL